MIRRQRNSWEVRVYVGRDPVTGKERSVSKSFPAKPSEKNPPRWVRDEERRLALEVRDGGHGDADVTVAELCARWLDTLDVEQLSPWTITGYRRTVDNYIVPRLGRVKLAKLTTAMLDRHYAELRRDGGTDPDGKPRPLSAQTVRRVHATIRRALNRAERWGWIDRNPAILAEPPRVRRKPMRTPDETDVERLIDGAADDPTLRLAVMLATTTGARRGELCGLQWVDIDLVQAAIRFARSVADPDGKIVVKAPKTDRVRVVAVGERILVELEAHRDRRRVAAQAIGAVFDPAGFVLSETEDGRTPLRPDTLSKRFSRLAKQVGVTCRLHDLRHGHVSWLLGAGVPVPDVAERVGHASSRMTLDVYGHALPATDRISAEIADRFLNRTIPTD